MYFTFNDCGVLISGVALASMTVAIAHTQGSEWSEVRW